MPLQRSRAQPRTGQCHQRARTNVSTPFLMHRCPTQTLASRRNRFGHASLQNSPEASKTKVLQPLTHKGREEGFTNSYA